MLKLTNKTIFTLFLIFSFSLGQLPAQLAKESALFKTLKVKDSLLFSIGFNTCDLQLIGELTSEDIEFYHDKGGMNDSKSAFLAVIKQNLCSTGKNQTQRILDENSLEVFPLYEQEKLYGAIQKGIHFFGNTQARFTHLWLLKNQKWRLSRVLSYDHKEIRRTPYSSLDFTEISLIKLEIYLGDYKFSPEFVLSIVEKEGKIYGIAQGDEVEIKPYTLHGFLSMDKSTKLDFKVDEEGKVIALHLFSPNGEMKAKKIK